MSEATQTQEKEEIPGLASYTQETNLAQRNDYWWLAPVCTLIGFGSFILYATWAAFQGQHYFVDPYLSPFYSPLVFINTAAKGSAPLTHAIFGEWPKWWPAFLPASPAFFILPFPAVFRLTCYYYRKAYYRSFMLTPPSCGVTPPKQNYSGETTLFLFQNLHRYAAYIAVIFVFILGYDATMAFFKHGKPGIGTGSIILTINAVLLASYTFGCHSIRHLLGGCKNSFGGCSPCSGKKLDTSYKRWKFISFLNERHMQLAWISLVWVALSDLYIRLVSLGVISDFNTWEGG